MYRKLIRTIQNNFPFLGEAKNELYHFARTKLGTVHDREFGALRYLPRRPNELFVDVGANRGQSIIAFRRFRPEAAIVSFEPSATMFRWLERHFSDWPNVRLMRIGLGSTRETKTLYVPRYRGFTYDGLATMEPSKATAYFSADTLFWFDASKISVETQGCEVRTLDSLDLTPTFMKIDVEGGEYEVLLGAASTLARCHPTLMIERFYDDQRIIALLAELGYQEVRREGRRFVPGASKGLNMFWMTPDVLARC